VPAAQPNLNIMKHNIGLLVSAGAVVAAVITLGGAALSSVPAARAAPNTDSQESCAYYRASGTYISYVGPDGHRYSRCCYNSQQDAPNSTFVFCDNYVDGQLVSSGAPLKRPPPSGPASPPANNPPINTKPPQAH
jgi:hypothetical protein